MERRNLMGASEQGMSRSEFLKTGALAAGVAAAAVAAPVAVSADEQEGGQNGGGVVTDLTQEQLDKIGKPHPGSAISNEPVPGTDPIPPLEPPQAWDVESDVVVVGLGGGGLTAALRCAEAGLSVMAVDKIGEAGGSATKEASNYITWGGTRVHGGLSAVFFQPYDAEVALVRQFMSSRTPIQYTRKLMRKNPECADWLMDHGVEFGLTNEFGDMATMSLTWKDSCVEGFFPRAAHLVTDKIYEAGKEAGVRYAFETQVTAIVKDGDRIVGVRAVNTDGEELFLKGEKGVIFTAGGFTANLEMLQKYCPSAYRTAVCCKLPPADTGEVIRMLWGAGADIAGFDSYAAYDGGIDAYWRGLGPWAHYLYSGDNQLSRQPWLSIDKTGQRHVYMHKRLKYDDYYDQQAIAMGYDPSMVSQYFWNKFGFDQWMVQDITVGPRQYVIFDNNYEQTAPLSKQLGCRRLLTPDMPNMDRMPEWMGPHDWREGAREAIEKGIIVSADTVEELADKLGLERDILRGAVDNWNRICEAGEDPEFYYHPDTLIPIDETATPLYGIPIGIQIGNTFCGAAIDPNWRPYDTKGHVIPGAYCGNMTGGFNGESFGFGGCSGSFVGGYIASESLIRDALGEEAVTYPAGWEAQDGKAPYNEEAAQEFLRFAGIIE